MKNCKLLLFLVLTSTIFAKDYVIYSIAQNIPMGEKDEIIKKNYYLNIGKSQGVQKGTIVDVFRNISRVDPYESKQRYNYKVKIGELMVLYSQTDSSIAKLHNLRTDESAPLFEIDSLMIGDKVNVKVDDN